MALGFAMNEDPQVARREALSANSGGRSRGLGFDMAANDPGTVAAAAQVMRKAGRHEDDELAHVAENEIIVPIRLQQARPDLVAAIRKAFVDAGMDPDRYVVADTDGPRNPGTGAEEFYDAGDGSASGGDSADAGDGPGGDPTDGSPAGDGGGVMGGSDPFGTEGSPAADGTGAYGGGAPTGSTGPVGNAPGRGVSADDVVGFVARALTKADLYDTAQKAFSGINQSVRDMGVSVVDGTGYSGPEGSPSPSAGFGGGDQGNDVGGANDEDRASPAAARRSTADQPSTLPATARPAGGFGFATVPRVNPTTGAQQFASLNQITRGGVTIGFDNQAEADAWAAANPLDSQDQAEAVAQTATATQVGQPAATIEDVKSERGAVWNAPGGGGYQDAMKQGHNDPTSDPANPQPFSTATLTAAGVDPTTYHQQNVAHGAGTGITDWGGRSDFNKSLYAYLQQKGYNPTFTGFGGGVADNFGNWLTRQNGDVQADVNAWLDANDPNRGITGGDGGSDAGSTSVQDRLDAILASDSPLMQRARTTGLQTANRRGLLNSSIAAEAAQNAMIDAALPIASQDADISNQQLMQQRDIELQQWLQQSDADLRKALQQGDLANQRWIAELDATTRRQIADLQVATADREKIGAMIAAAQQNYTSQYEAILNNPNIPAEQRGQHMTHIANVMRAAISFIEQSFGVDLTWDITTNSVSGG